MNNTRKRLPLALDEDDQKTMQETLRRGGMKSGVATTSNTTEKPEDENVAGDRAVETEAPMAGDDKKEKAEAKNPSSFSRANLRPQVSQNSDLAMALGEFMESLDPTTKKLVKPSNILATLISDNDRYLADKLRKNIARK